MIPQLEGFDAYVTENLDKWQVPGVAVAVVKHGEVVLTQGYGLCNVEKEQELNADTLLAIGSSSKAFTTMAMGILVDDGKLEWDRPLREYLPTFRLQDLFATERMTPRDLVTHRSGLPRHDLMWYNSPFGRQELFDRLRYLEPNKDFRTFFQYQNLMYLTAGYLVGKLSDSSWEAFVRERIFVPLEMENSNFSVEEMQQSPNCSLPYQKKEDEIQPIPFRNIDTVGPAGSINSSVVEMANWLLLHLGDGTFKGQQVVSQSNLNEMHTPQMVIQSMPGMDIYAKQPEIGDLSYGLGWFIQHYRGRKLVHHGGNIDGFSAMVAFLPEQDVGAVVLSNLNGTQLPMVISFNVFDRLLGLEQLDWSTRIKEEMDKLEEAAEAAKEKSAEERNKDTRPSHPLEDYAGEYGHPGYGVLVVEQDGDQLAARFNDMEFPMAHYHYDVFDLSYEQFDMVLKASFGLDVKGNVSQVSIPLEPMVAPIVFERVAASGMSDKAFLEQFSGTYEVMDREATVFLKGENVLALSLSGQPAYELSPYQGTAFNLKGMPGFSIEFKQDASGTVTEAVLTQPGAVFTARKTA
jgi:CubicO group peptidase (beta-lactamase class C family)